MSRRLADKTVAERLRQAYLRRKANGLSAAEVAARIGWFTKARTRHGKPIIAADVQRLERALGLKLCTEKRYKGGPYVRRYRETLTEDTALEITEALGEFPVDVGL